jgi:prevent-host-death family protein
MKHVPIAAFKDRVSEYIAETERGEDVIITRHGKPAARLMPVEPDEDQLRARRRKAMENLVTLRKELYDRGVRVSADEIIAWKNEGQK